MPASWDVFCRVIDNFGDAGVCWRLARILALEQGAKVRLWVAGLETLQRLEPAITGAARQSVGGIEIGEWTDTFPQIDPAEVTIEAFGCGLPEGHVQRMAARASRSLWIVLEHLSAEPWVPDYHGLPSPHPREPLERYFFFPGFIAGTGGLLREADLPRRREAFGAAQRDAFWRAVGHAPAPGDATLVSLFAYGGAPLADLLEACASAEAPTVAALPQGVLTTTALRYFGSSPPASRVLRRGSLELRILPFLPQLKYDELLWSCDVNFVRGEDSFVRAQWAARPFVWHVYPQGGEAHRAKLEAFLERYAPELADAPAEAIARLMRVWNGIGAPGATLADAWRAFLTERAQLHARARAWAAAIAQVGSLTENLAAFCLGKLK